MSRGNRIGAIEKGQVWKKKLAGFISQILIKKSQNTKKISNTLHEIFLIATQKSLHKDQSKCGKL
jgi:hypothetical protein